MVLTSCHTSRFCGQAASSFTLLICAGAGSGGVMGVEVDQQHARVRGANVSVMSPTTPPEALGSATTDARWQFKIDKSPAARNLTVTVTKTFRVATIQRKKQGARVG